VLVVVLAAVGAEAAWYFSSEVVVPDHSAFAKDTTVDGIAGGHVVLSRSENSERPGVYGLDGERGHAAVGEIVGRTAATVTRRLCAETGEIQPGTKVAVDPDVYAGNPTQALGLTFSNVNIPDELGPMPAWFVPGRTEATAIVVHGINGNREGDLREVPALHREGLGALVITYRGDVGAPPGPDGLHHMGLTEWRDLEAAVRYALARGARRLVIAGTSMGGAVTAQFMEHSPLAPRVAALVLDAPALSWKAILSFNATEMGLPSFAADPVEWLIGARIDANWNSLDALLHPNAFRLPILLFHGTADKLVPIATSNAFAAELPREVTYYRVPHAGHAEAWNVGPALDEHERTAFLSRVVGLPEPPEPRRDACGLPEPEGAGESRGHSR
jgi:uncharacterized protein